ncbi:hypothetical protein B0H17DRAFT_1138603 [Mycena rosella]|uniref:Uncharacterized protein n=1 Tax=Mycena rosella TaxID=1033263 RepID=A0AAD7GC23_MYCRO|nr:hypothetical protein B0H17DRAFT_1138603 [Mycena rosella]
MSARFRRDPKQEIYPYPWLNCCGRPLSAFWALGRGFSCCGPGTWFTKEDFVLPPDLRKVKARKHNWKDLEYYSNSYTLTEDVQEIQYAFRRPEAKRLHSKLKGMHHIGITSFAYFPLTSATPDTPALIKKAAESVDVLKKSGKLESGQADILDKQIQTFKDDTLLDLEIIVFSGMSLATIAVYFS